MSESTEGSQDQPSQEEQPSQQELRERIEEQLRRIRVQDVLLESVAGILNLVARRITREEERDLEQARIGIEAARAVAGFLDEEPARGVRDAIAELQMLYARQVEGKAAGEPKEGGPQPEPAPEQKASREDPRSRLWTPPGSG